MSDSGKGIHVTTTADETSDFAVTADLKTAQLREGIERTRAEMSATIGALEHKLDPVELRERAVVELHNVEVKVKEAVREQMHEAQTMLKTEFAQARGIIIADLVAAKENLKGEVATAFNTAKQTVRNATIGKVETMATQIGDVMSDTRDTLVETIRQNPIPSALAGIGLAWLFMNRSRGSSDRRNAGGHRGPGLGDTLGQAIHGVERRVASAAGDVGNAVGTLAQGATGAASTAAQAVLGTANRTLHDVAHTASGLATQTSEAAGVLAHRATDVAGQIGETARNQARMIEGGFQSTLEDNPLALGAAALVVGTALGFALPRTRREDAWMGDARDHVIHRAGDAARDAVHAVQHAAEKAADEAKGALREAAR